MKPGALFGGALVAFVPLVSGADPRESSAPHRRVHAEAAEQPEPTASPQFAPTLVNVEGTYEMMSLSTLVVRDLRPSSAETSGSGAGLGLGAGLRFAFLTIGGRARFAHLDVANLSTIDAELGARVTVARWEPHFAFGFGYARMSGNDANVAGLADLDIHGYNARAGLGIDYFAAKGVSLGFAYTGELLVMARPGVDLSVSPRAQAEERARTCNAIADVSQKQQCVLNLVQQAEGASAGFASTLSLVMGVHF